MSFSIKSYCIVLVLMFFTATTTSGQDEQESSTIESFSIDFTTTESAYSNSWVGGEASSANWVANLNTVVTSSLKYNLGLRSRYKFSFGLTYIQNSETKVWSKPQKSTDLIDLDNVLSLPVDWPIDPYAAIRAETQFYDGRNPDKKLTLSPLKLTESIGITKTFHKEEKDLVLSRLGLGIRQTFTKIITDSVTLAVKNSTTRDGGIESVSEVDFALHKNIRYNGKLSLFKALFDSDSDDQKGTEFENDWKAVELNFENGFSGTITKAIAVNLYFQFLYDKDISHKFRFKQTLALGVVWKVK